MNFSSIIYFVDTNDDGCFQGSSEYSQFMFTKKACFRSGAFHANMTHAVTIVDTPPMAAMREFTAGRKEFVDYIKGHTK